MQGKQNNNEEIKNFYSCVIPFLTAKIVNI